MNKDKKDGNNAPAGNNTKAANENLQIVPRFTFTGLEKKCVNEHRNTRRHICSIHSKTPPPKKHTATEQKHVLR